VPLGHGVSAAATGPVLDTRAVPPLANDVNGGEAYEEALDWLSKVETGEPLYPNGRLPR
jgi:hypothetical protein